MAEKTAAKQFGKHRHWFHAGLAVLLLALQLLFADKAKCRPACLARCAYLPDRSGLFLLNRIIRC